MKTNLTTIIAIIMALNIIPMAVAANGRPARQARDGFDGLARGNFRPGVMAQLDNEGPEFAPRQALRPQARPFIQRYMQNRRQNSAPQAFAHRGQGYGRGFEAQARPFADDDFRGRGRMDRPFRNQPDSCPFCGQGMGQARRQGGQRHYAQQNFAPRGQGRMMDRPFRAQRQNRFIQEENDRSYGPQAFEGRAQRHQQDFDGRPMDQTERPFRGRGMGMGRLEQDEENLAQPPVKAPQGRRQGRGVEDAQEDPMPQPQDRPQQQEQAPQRQRRDRQQFRDMEDNDEQLPVQPRAGLRRNAQ